MLNLVKELCDLEGVSGDEEKVRDYIISKIKDKVEDLQIDSIGNITCMKKGAKQPKKKLMVCAHMDEVGFIIKKITDDGYLKFAPVGGIDTKVMLGKRVKMGDVLGVIGIKAVHLTTLEERKVVPAVSAMYIDIGATSKADAESKVALGSYFSFDSTIYEFGDKLLKAKALDDRFGCAVMLQLIDQDLKYDTYFSFNVQEETGLRGAMVSAYNINPDIALVLESTTAADLADIEPHKQVCHVGSGPVISFMDGATIYDQALYQQTTTLANTNSIAWQTKTMIAGGNDSGAIHKTRDGVKTVSISLPTRYLHSSSSVASIKDMESVMKLVEQFVKEDFE